MATPDTTNFKSASDVFAATYTLPQIRAIHKSLHTQSEEKSARLRNKVGSSYRSLLGTADTIVEMKADADSVQTLLSRMSMRTSAAVLKKKTAGLNEYGAVVAAGDKNVEVGEMARARVWEATKGVISGVLRGSEALGLAGLGRGERLVLATKLVVLRRVLIASFKGGIPMSPYARRVMNAADQGQEGLRHRIGRGIEKALEQVPEVSEDTNVAALNHRDVVLKALAAYSLLTNAGAKDALQHLLHVRGAAMAVAFEVDGEEKREIGVDDLLRALRLYTATLLDIQSLVPYRIAAELQGLKKTRLLDDPSLRALDVLRLDVYEKWCGEQVQFFTPFIRHDDLDAETAKNRLFTWARIGGKVLVDGLEKALSHMNEFKSITALRTEVLQHWIREGSRAKGIDADGMLDRLREVINAQLRRVLDTKVTKIHLVSSEIESTLSSWIEKDTDVVTNLWTPGAFTLDVSNGSSGSGAGTYITNVLAGINGHNHAVSRALGRYQAWSSVIGDVQEVVELLRRQRWDNDYDEIEAEETIEERQQALSKDDPQELGDRLTTSLEAEFKALEEKLVVLWTKKKESPNAGGIAAYLLRVVRGLRSALPDIAAVKGFALDMVPELQGTVVKEVCMAPIDEFVLGPLERRIVVGRGLWEGDGENALPTQPSPGTFRFLRNITAAMADRGADLWSPVAVGLLKKNLVEFLEGGWKEALRNIEEEVEAEKKKEKEKKKEQVAKVTQDEDKSKDEDAGKVEGQTEDSDEGAETKEKPESGSEEGTEKEKPESGSDEGTKEDSKEDTITQRRDLFIQWHYDVVYLGHPLSISEDDEALKALQGVLFENSGLDESVKPKLAKSASDYWKRTFALFGFL